MQNTVWKLMQVGAEQGVVAGGIRGATDIVDEKQDKLKHILGETTKGAVFGGAAAPVVAAIPVVGSTIGKPLQTWGNRAQKTGAALRGQRGLAGAGSAIFGGPVSGLGVAAGVYGVGGAASVFGKGMMNIGSRIQAMPEKYRVFLECNQQLGEKALGANIFVLNQKDPEFREAWKATGE